MHATEFLAAADPDLSARVIVMFGSERYFRQECLKRIPGCSADSQDGDADDDQYCLTRVEGQNAAWQDILAELSTVSMFGDQRVVLVEDADQFVSDNRPALEDYVRHPARRSVLILDVKTFPSNTRLAKAVAESGLIIECTELKKAALVPWLRRMADEQFGKELLPSAAQLIIQLAGTSPGQLHQELAKLAALVGDTARITEADVSQVVGGWRLETTWAMLDAVRDGKPGFAFESLEKLLRAGETPQKILGGTVFVFRRLSEATELARTGMPLGQAITTSGTHPMSAGQCERYLRRIGYANASRILQWLAEADHDMKGGSRANPSVLLERLFVRLSGEVVTGSRTG